MNNIRTYKVGSKPIVSKYYERSSLRIIRDESIQKRYFNEAYASFLDRFVKLREDKEMTEADKARLRKLLEHLFEAKDILSGKNTDIRN